MGITPEHLREFIEIYEKEFGERISEDEAREVAFRLVELYQVLGEPLRGETQRVADERS